MQTESKENLKIKPIIVDSEMVFDQSLKKLLSESYVAVDLESAGLKRFSQVISLIQIGTNFEQYLLDPLNISLKPLKLLFENSSIEKIFFDGIQDIQMIKRDLNCSVSSIFDVSFAYNAINPSESTTGLKEVLNQFFDINLSKKLQKTDWEKRPLTDDMVMYASLDVAYLIPLRHELAKQLKEKQLFEDVTSFCNSFELVRPINPLVSERFLFLNILKKDEFDELEQILIKRIHDYRVNVAKRRDKPFYFIFGNDQLVKIVKEKPKTMKELEMLKIKSIKNIKIKEKIISIITNTTNDYSSTSNIYNLEVKKFIDIRMEIGRRNSDLLDENLELDLEVNIEQMKKQRKTIRKWRKDKAEELMKKESYFIPNFVMRELSFLDYSKRKTIPLMPGINEDFIKNFGEELVNLIINSD
ncbi:MAG: Ribonuclease D [Candidatus Heimdallarchaeota archaeon LC_3]|nr:MAG: Ribonuclease D [Candidatus Heimdallarchaeota archaeon LC_3]